MIAKCRHYRLATASGTTCKVATDNVHLIIRFNQRLCRHCGTMHRQVTKVNQTFKVIVRPVCIEGTALVACVSAAHNKLAVPLLGHEQFKVNLRTYYARYLTVSYRQFVTADQPPPHPGYQYADPLGQQSGSNSFQSPPRPNSYQKHGLTLCFKENTCNDFSNFTWIPYVLSIRVAAFTL